MAEKKTGVKGLFDAMLFGQGAVPALSAWLVVILLGTGVWYGAWKMGFTGITPPFLSVVGGEGYQVAAAPSTSGVSQLPNCGNQFPIAQMIAYYNDPSNNNLYTQVATTDALYQAGSPTPADSLTTNTSGVVTSTSGALSCGTSYREIAGDGGGSAYYYTRTADFVVDNSVVPAPDSGKGLKVIPSDAAILYVKDTTTNWAATNTFNWTAAGKGNGSTSSGDLMIKVQSPTSPAMFGDLGYAVCFRFDSTNLSSVKVIGGNAVSISHVKATAGLDTIQCSEMPPMKLGGYDELSLQLKGATAGPANGTLVDVYLVDKTNELYNGYLIPDENAKAGVSGNGYDQINDPNTGLGIADVNTNSAFTITR